MGIQFTSEGFAKALGAIAAMRPAKTIASMRSQPMVNHRRHPLEGMRFIMLVSEDGRMRSRNRKNASLSSAVGRLGQLESLTCLQKYQESCNC